MKTIIYRADYIWPDRHLHRGEDAGAMSFTVEARNLSTGMRAATEMALRFAAERGIWLTGVTFEAVR